MRQFRRGIIGIVCMAFVLAALAGFAVTAKAAIATPKLKEAKATEAGTIEVTWEEVEGAKEYRIYRRTGDTWKKIAAIEPAAKYEDTSAKPTVEYYYTVRAVDDSNQLSDYDKTGVKAAVPLNQPKLVGVLTKDNDKLQITWEKVPGASYYNVYRAQSGDKYWTPIAKKITDTRYVDATVKAGETYKYTVRSAVIVGSKVYLSDYKLTLTGKLSGKEQISLATVKLIGANSLGLSGITVTWEALPEADGYYIYRLNGSKWKRKGMVSGQAANSWTDKNVKAGKTYTYTVRAYTNYGTQKILSAAWDNTGVKGTCQLQAPKLKSASASYSTGNITVTWEKVEYADGYYVYRKTADTTWKYIGTTTTALTYTDKTASKNTEYTYTVRAYAKVGKKTRKGLYDEKGITAKSSVTRKTVDGLELYYDSDGELITDTTSIIGSQTYYKAEVDYDKNIVTMYAKGSNGTYNVPVKAFICSTGDATPIGTHYTSDKYRWHELMGPCWGQWCTRIVNGVLFHSVYYNSYNNNNDLSVSAYNKLGTKCSHGCVRLTARDAKWIYDNCRSGMAVTISRNCKNPFGKPSAYKLKSDHTWDPTDPNMYYKCQDRGCH